MREGQPFLFYPNLNWLVRKLKQTLVLKNIKVLAGVVGLVGAMYLLIQFDFQEVQYERFETKEVVEEVVKEAWQTDEEAIQAAKDVIRKKELQAELTQLDSEIAEKQAKRKEVANELASY